MPDENKAWDEMIPYQPFVCEDAGDALFTAELLDVMPGISDKQKVIVCCDGADMPRVELYEWQGQWLMEIAPLMEAPIRFYIISDKAFSKAQFRVLGSLRFSVNTVLMMMYAFATARKNTLLMHASVTVREGKGYLFLGRSGTGKSTHSQLWIKNIEGCSLLNDDNPILRVMENGEIRVFGSPWSGKTPCYKNDNVPVGAFVNLRQAKKNAIRRLSLPEAYAAMCMSFSGYRFIREMADGFHATNEKVVSTVPFYLLECLPDAEAAWLCHNTVTQ